MSQAPWRFLPIVSLAGLLAVPTLAHGDVSYAYYCAASRAYYPAVWNCPAPWTPVPVRAVAEPPPRTAPALPQVPAVTPTPAAPAAQPTADVAAPPAAQPPAPNRIEPPPASAAVSATVAVFVFGPQQHPVECTPGQVCDLTLAKDEHVRTIKLGDGAGWVVDTATEGEGRASLDHLLLTPQGRGPDASMVIITNQRTYHLRLTTATNEYMARISFSYEDETAPDTPAAEEASPKPQSSLPADKKTAAADTGMVTVGGVAFVRGREPKALGAGRDHPSASTASQQAKATQAPIFTAADDARYFAGPAFAPPAAAAREPPLPAAAPRPAVEKSALK